MGGAYTAFKNRAYLLIEVKPGSEAGLIAKIEGLPNVVNADFVHGGYDIVCVLEGEFKDMDDTVIQIRKLTPVLKTTTLTVFDTALQ
jgi:hypothetical protein